LLAPGLNVLNNQTGGPEPLARTDQAMPLTKSDLDYLIAGFRGATVEAAHVSRRLERTNA
jgi:hypothetical protein